MVDEFLRRGWHVFATMRRAEERKDLLADAMEAHPTRLDLLDLDVTDPWERSAAAQAIRKHGRLDCLVNNAGYGVFGALEDLSEEQLRRQFEVNFFGAALLTRTFLPLLRDASGAVVFVSSGFGESGFPLTSAYCASKFAMEGLAESLFYELKPHGVHVGLIEPGANATGFGDRVNWAEGTAEAYRDQTAGYHELKARISSRAKDRTAKIAAITADYAEGRRRGLRTRVGMDAASGSWFKALVPQWLALPLSGFAFGRLFRPSPEGRRKHEEAIAARAAEAPAEPEVTDAWADEPFPGERGRG
jgi:NAD(P)-dependent dehydrogenase (short-subunit alcohol dehydrogenase family)